MLVLCARSACSNSGAGRVERETTEEGYPLIIGGDGESEPPSAGETCDDPPPNSLRAAMYIQDAI
eukprot:gene772-biopygen7957